MEETILPAAEAAQAQQVRLAQEHKAVMAGRVSQTTLPDQMSPTAAEAVAREETSTEP